MNSSLLYRHSSFRGLSFKHRSRIVANYAPPPYEPNIVVIQPTETDIYPPFFEAYTKMCDIPSFVAKVDAKECIQTLTIPPYDVQMSVLQDVLEMQRQFPPLEQIQPYLIHYMIDQNIEKVNELLQSYQLYLLSVDHVQDLIIEALRG